MTDPRRLSFLYNARSYISSITCNQPHTHSLFFFYREHNANDILKNFQSANVLHFVKTYLVLFRKTGDLKGLIHLRYLRIDSVALVGEFADCIWSLQNLETLDVTGEDIAPTGIWKLKRLRHLYIRENVKLLGEEQGANDKTMQNLQTLCYVSADPQLGFLLNNGNFSSLRKLSLWFERDPSYSVDEQLRSLHFLSNLRTLKLEYRHKDGSVGPVRSLDAIAFPTNLTKITLKHFEGLDSQSMNALGRITNLQILKLAHGQGSAQSLNCGAARNFPQLQVLYLKELYFKRLILEEGAMPHLRRVVIRSCHHLAEVPERVLSLGNLRQVQRNAFSIKHWETASNI